jgi:hypothetical protein
MNTKDQIMDNIDDLIDIIQRNNQRLSTSQFFIFSRRYKEIQTIKSDFYTIVGNLTSEFTEQELYGIEADLLFYYETLKEMIDFIAREFRNNPPPTDINTRPRLNTFSFVTLDDVESSIIKQEDIDKYKIYIQRRIEGIKKEIEKNQKMQLRHLAEIYNLYNGLADNLDQQMMTMDEQLYVRQTQQHEAIIKNIINDLDGV